MAGVIIDRVDFDDINDKCKCGKSAGAYAVKTGVESQNDVKSCSTFGLTMFESYMAEKNNLMFTKP